MQVIFAHPRNCGSQILHNDMLTVTVLRYPMILGQVPLIIGR